MQAFEQGNQGEEISWASGGKDSSNFAAAAIEAVRGKAGSLFVPNHPMVKLRGLTQRFIKRDVMNAGDAKARGNAVLQQGSDYSMRTGHLAGLDRGMRGNGHARHKIKNEIPLVDQRLVYKKEN